MPLFYDIPRVNKVKCSFIMYLVRNIVYDIPGSRKDIQDMKKWRPECIIITILNHVLQQYLQNLPFCSLKLEVYHIIICMVSIG